MTNINAIWSTSIFMIFIVGLIIGPSLAKASHLPKAILACQGPPQVAPDKLG